ncbi:MAG: hypothetical protein AABZ77_03345 [Chloroflexota bacterium]
MRVLLIALIPVIFLWVIDSPPAAAQSAGEYFKIDYGSANLSQSEVSGGGVFYAAIRGKVTCTKDLPMSVSEATITSRMVAKDTVNGTVVILNPSYTVILKPFPSKMGVITEIKLSVPLQFPDTAASGDYNIVAELIEAKVKVAFIWAPVTEYLPQSQPIGSVKYSSPGISQSPSQSPVTSPSTTLPPQPALAPAPASVPVTASSLAREKSGFAWWMWLVVAIALVTTLVNTYFILRYRTARRASR